VSFLSEVEKGIERAFRSWTERVFGPAQSDQLIVSHHAVLEDIAGKVQTLARGTRVFPYNTVLVSLPGVNEAVAARLAQDIEEALRAGGCELPAGFQALVEEGPLAVAYENRARTPAPIAAAKLIVVRGKAALPEYTLDRPRTNIGRLAELTDSRERVVRRNDVVFEESADDANATVSRGHAHICREGAEYRICDDGSQHGTHIFREGRSIDVSPANRRGERLRPGDEIYLGRACLRFE